MPFLFEICGKWLFLYFAIGGILTPSADHSEGHMSSISLKINGQAVTVDDIPSDMPLLWALRDKLNLVGTKYSCGIGVCGSCAVLVNGVPMRSCVVPATSMAGMEITTIEGLDPTGEHPVQKAWNEVDVPQCGYCQGGQILTASALLKQNPNPSDEDIDSAMAGVLCRCGTYHRIRKAIKLAASYAAESGGGS
jgi:isoquinoline 1-oxidoreductase alpha subunit